MDMYPPTGDCPNDSWLKFKLILSKTNYFWAGHVRMVIPMYIPIRVAFMIQSPCIDAKLGGFGGSSPSPSDTMTPRNRSFYIQVPTGLNDRPAPLLIALHAQGFEADSPGPSKSGVKSE